MEGLHSAILPAFAAGDQCAPPMPMLSPRTAAFLAMFVTVSIYGGQFVSVRWGLRQGLSASDMAALRFIVAGAVLAPFFLRAGPATCAGLGWGRGLVLAATGGVPLTLLSNVGLNYAPAAHASAIQPGMVAATATMLAYLGMRMRIPLGALVGFSIVLSGLAAIAIAGSTGTEGGRALIGDVIFAVCGAGWGVFTWLCVRWQVPPVVGASVVSTLSAAAFLPFYFAFLEPGLGNVGWPVLAFHGVNQGLLNIVVGLLLWTYGTRTLGVALAARFPPMIPVLGTLIGIPALGEVPSPLAAAGVSAIVVGLLVAAAAGTGRR